MFSDAQIQYVETVLGASVNYFGSVQASLSPTPEALTTAPAGLLKVLIKTPTLAIAEKTLLMKIMASVKLAEFTLIEDLSTETSAQHVLEFSEAPATGRIERGSSTHWQLPSLTDMNGGNPDLSSESVVDLKKTTWELMKQLAKEISK